MFVRYAIEQIGINPRQFRENLGPSQSWQFYYRLKSSPIKPRYLTNAAKGLGLSKKETLAILIRYLQDVYNGLSDIELD